MQLSKKIVVLGHYGVGKTSLIKRFVEDTFSDNYKVSIGVHITKKIVEVSGSEDIKLILWDLEGTMDMSLIRDSYLVETDAYIYVYDVTRPVTFQNLDEDFRQISERLPGVPGLLVGNKTDLMRLGNLKNMLDGNNITYDYLTSAKSGDNVEHLFNQIANLIGSNDRPL